MLPNIGTYFPIQKYRFLQKLYFFVIIYHMVREFLLDIREYKDRTMVLVHCSCIVMVHVLVWCFGPCAVLVVVLILCLCIELVHLSCIVLP